MINNPIDSFLNRITMYRLALYVLTAFLLAGVALAFFGYIPYSPVAILFETLFIITVTYVVNLALSHIYKVTPNVESVYITAFILTLIIAPPLAWNDTNFYSLALIASLIAIASKFIITIKKKHTFNPAAFGVTITALVLNQYATWWIGTLAMLPIVVIGGLLIVRKLERFQMVLSFLIVAFVGSLISFGISLNDLTNLEILGSTSLRIIASTPLFFFAFIMLTEPATAPSTHGKRILYGSLVGLLSVPILHIGPIYSTPELALILGNIFSYIISPKQRLVLALQKIEEVAHETYDFVFKFKENFTWKPGQYLEWTIPGTPTDSRGNRRYFTIASAPSEKEIRIGIKFYPKPSTFKKHLMELLPGTTVFASERAGEFTLPTDPSKKLVFLAGGIGITPFRSMLKFLIDKKEKRDIVLIYSNQTIEDIAYSDIFEDATKKIGLKTIYTLTKLESIPKGWPGESGFVDIGMIKKFVPNFDERIFYISGPRSMVTTFESVLKEMGVKHSHIKTDFFPGYA